MLRKFIARLMRFGGEAAPVAELPVQSAAERFAREATEERALSGERRQQQEQRMAALHNAKPIEEAEETIEIPVELEEKKEDLELPKAA